VTEALLGAVLSLAGVLVLLPRAWRGERGVPYEGLPCLGAGALAGHVSLGTGLVLAGLAAAATILIFARSRGAA
jgi:hypothetical protein